MKRLAFEFKLSRAPKTSKGFPGTLDVLKPDRVWIVSPVEEPYDLKKGITVTNLPGALADVGMYL